MDQAILQSLTAVGLSEKESRVFIALLGLGEGTASAIAKKAEIKRSIVYFTLQKLIENGYAQEIGNQKVKRYVAVPAMRLLQHVQANVENLRMMIPLLNAMQRGREDQPHIELFEGKEAILPVYRSMEFAQQSLYFTCWEKVKSTFPEEVRRWSVNAASIRNPNKVKNLIVDDEAGHEMAKAVGVNPRQEFRVLPKDLSYRMNIGIADTTVAITNFDPLFVVVIRSKVIAEGVAALFELAWQSAKPLRLR